MKLRVLGCGTSSGVPRIGNDWGACDPGEPRNRRLRVSVIVELGGSTVLVDTGPDLREQLLAATTARVDALVWTHDHADHCHGIDDVRQIFHHRGGRAVPGYARAGTLATLRRRFGYAFAGNDGYPPTVEAHPLPDRLEFGAAELRVVDQPHGSISSAGLVFTEAGRKLVYATDLNGMTDAMREAYRGADVLIIDALRRHPHPTHPHLSQALGWIAELGVERALLTHMDQSMDYRTLCAELPDHVRPAHDGMEVDFGEAEGPVPSGDEG